MATIDVALVTQATRMLNTGDSVTLNANWDFSQGGFHPEAITPLETVPFRDTCVTLSPAFASPSSPLVR